MASKCTSVLHRRMHYAWARLADKYVVSMYIHVTLGTNQYEKHRELSREWLQIRLVSASRRVIVSHTSAVGCLALAFAALRDRDPGAAEDSVLRFSEFGSKCF
jgi:hypothetical protein